MIPWFKYILFLCVIAISLISSFSYANEQIKKRPNILWIYVEDISPHLGTYGEPLVNTPILDELAHNGVKFTNTIMPAPVCSALRSAMMTGVTQTKLGLHNHHSARTKESEFYLPPNVKTVPELFKAAGYYTFNSGKDDYNFSYNRADLYNGDYMVHPLYGKSGVKIDWHSRSNKSQPFFGQIQLKGGKHIFSKTFKNKVKQPIDRSEVVLPPYYPTHPTVTEEWARYLESLQITDSEVGDIIKRLERDKLLDNTIVFFFADHGMRFLRHKQFLYEGGIKVPFIVYAPGYKRLIKTGTRAELINGLNISATSLALAGIEIPDYFEGSNLFDENFHGDKHVISARDRCDFTIDRIRSVRTENYKYIRNYYPERSAMQPSYRDEWELTKVMKQLYEHGKLNKVQAMHFSPTREIEELYDLRNDPHEIVNLATKPDYKTTLDQHRKILDNWVKDNDMGQFPEREESLKLMLGIWGDTAINPEFDNLRKQYPNLSGSQYHLKSQRFKRVLNKGNNSYQ
ncbi:sulfatase [Pseudoalteromonas sp. MMG005]|uniref:sulfatase family protein n=1 Tax=Pseudoalteromonas sp. MMG005 TaxID=2822682 RepID=UPI001B3A62CD|nr:sulfatase [Pseudoalteromonas sp. MMG005]MBQ4846693.1 sulfatase [Pseudoalteromonas sp. MMG005]